MESNQEKEIQEKPQVISRRSSSSSRNSKGETRTTSSGSGPTTKVLHRQWLEPQNKGIIDSLEHKAYEAGALEEFAGPLFKVILIGDSGIGKSCVLKRQIENAFSHLDVTVGVEFGNYIVNVENTPLKLEIWDTAGQDAYRSITKIFYRGANAIILGYSIANSNSFKNLVTWMEEINESVENDVPIFLVGNKADLLKQRKVSQEDALNFQDQNDIDYLCETSALSGENVDVLFLDIAKMLYSQFQRHILAYKYKKAKSGQSSRNEPISFVGKRQHGSFALADSEYRATELLKSPMTSGSDQQQKRSRRCRC